MAHLSDFLTPEEVTKLDSLQLTSRELMEGFIAGMHRSPHKGFSIEFAQHRPYVQGDDIRRLDWKVYGKTGRNYVREYEEETNLRAHLLVDLSGSMAYAGEGRPTKARLASKVAAALSYLFLNQRDAVGLVTFDTEIRSLIPARTSNRHLSIILNELGNAEPGGETDLGGVLETLVPRLPRRGVVILISDLFGDIAATIKALAHFRLAHHEVILFHILDRDEVEFPFDHWTRFDSMEVPEQFRLVDTAHFRSAYLANLRQFQEELKQGCQRHRMECVPIMNDESMAEVLAKFLLRRREKR
ncbi:MAG: DUF58 domain-containing protein [Pedosphaera sp.]|nr:DUF58 domain-containing protein [Pedosphaera sp.]